MAELKQGIFSYFVFLLILEGMSSVWEFIDIVSYGESQRSIADLVAAIFITSCIVKRYRSVNDDR